jgi:hypothetical protein
MILDFPVHDTIRDRLDNYELFIMPNGIYRAREVVADNYLYPMYAYYDGEAFVTATSVYALIRRKGRFVRNPRFQTTHFFRPTFLTPDAEIMRVRTTHRRSTKELTDPERIIKLGAELMQEYVSEIEHAYLGAVHILLMGGKDSQNIILANRSERWVVLSGEPNTSLNERFVEGNGIAIERFVGPSNETDDRLLAEELLASDCFYDVAHFRYLPLLRELVNEFEGKAVIWMGTSGDGVFSRNNNHRDSDYYAVHDLHVGMAMGIYHQVIKNLLNIPVVSPFQSPRMLDELFYRFNPYFVDRVGDVRAQIGEILLGRPVKYPDTNPGPDPWKRNRCNSLPIYIKTIKKDGVPCVERRSASAMVELKERMQTFFNYHSLKRRTSLSRILFTARTLLSRWFPALRNKRHDITATEIR